MGKKISIIIPVYNTEKYLKMCIESVLGQTYQNIEVICVNDGSIDDSGKILDIFAEKDSRLKVIHKKNGGVSAARNDALEIATGDWIGFIDSDDYISDVMYETMMEANREEKADIISCGYYLAYEEKNVLAENKKPVPDKAVATKSFLRYVYERDVYKGVASYLWTRLISRDLLYGEDGALITRFATDLDMSEDLLFLAEVMLRSESSLYVEKPMYYYLQRANSVCHDERKQLERLSWVKGYQRLLEMFDKNPIDEDVYNLIVRMMVFRCGKFMELASKYQDEEAYHWLKEIVERYYSIYKEANAEHPERIQWMDDILKES